ncbi:MAG: PAS domain S-box protein [Bacteroidia bacterium]|nr:PAS domain S-box protein [Bacteroidia bacterium]MDW8236029.1 PAS domain S-box protein [Bacteroidia bacterium]
MRRWGVAEYLGIGLSILVGGVGFLLLLGLWIITQRDLALWENQGNWYLWERAFSLWAYGTMVGILLLTSFLALWWWNRIGRGYLRLRDGLRNLLRENPSPPLSVVSSPAEAVEMWHDIRHAAELIHFLQQVVRGERYTLSPHLAQWPVVARQLAAQLLEKIEQTHASQHFYQQALAYGSRILRLGEQAASVEEYLHQAGPLLIEAAGAQIGAFYKLEGEKLRRIYGYAYPREAPEVFSMGEGWIGQAALEGRALWFNTLPEGYIEALSGLGHSPPQSLAVLPLIAGQSIQGVWDIASFSEWGPNTSGLMEYLLLFFAVGYLIQEESQRQKMLLQEYATLQQQATEKHQEIGSLKSNLSALQAQLQQSQEQLLQSEALSEKLAAQLHQEKYRQEVIFSSISEAVLLFDASGKMLYISPSVSKILGYLEAELQIFFRPVEKNDMEIIRSAFQKVLEAPQDPQTFRFRYRHKKGYWLWLEATARNLIQHPALRGILVVLRNISEEIEYEKQYRARLKFQSLVENSPDIIFRTDREGRFLYINPTIERYTGYSPSHYIRNSIYSVGFSLEEVKFWRSFIDRVFGELSVQSAEIDFPSVYGVRRMAVRGIPEASPDGEIETIVILLQDITELRHIQEQLHQQNLNLQQARVVLEAQKRELEEKNRDIMESIQYARRIQGILLPDEASFKEFFPESFVIYWLRDVVGGDLYWSTQIGSWIAVAVVDCTGHGVPGAFMSFLAYTLLETAVRERQLIQPAEVLQFIDMRLRTLFSGQERSQIGMEVALCMIDTEKKVLLFSGAHRPLLFHQGGQWHFIPGGPAGLGGASWLDEMKTFYNHVFSYQPGDVFYLYTDGFADQLSSQHQRRYSHRRLREFLMNTAQLPMSQQHTLLLQELRGWMGENSATDDITVLGVRL